MRNLWLVQRSDIVSHDEYESWIVRANDPEQAALAVWDRHGGDFPMELGCPRSFPDFRAKLEITPVRQDGAIAIVHESFRGS